MKKSKVNTYKMNTPVQLNVTTDRIKNWRLGLDFLKSVVIAYLVKNKEAICTVITNNNSTIKVDFDPNNIKIDLKFRNGEAREKRWNTVERDSTYGRDYDFYVSIIIKDAKYIKFPEEYQEVYNKPFKYQLGKIQIHRMPNCCGMAVLTDIKSYAKRMESKLRKFKFQPFFGTFLTSFSELLSYMQGYRAVTLTGKQNYIKNSALENMGYSKTLSWKNKRTGNDLVMFTKELKLDNILKNLQFTIGEVDEVSNFVESSEVESEILDLLTKKKEAKKS